MVSGQVLRFFRVTFLDLHSSITTFVRHLDFMLRVHFTQLTSLLCMMPYDLVSEEEAPLVGVTVAAPAPAPAAIPAGGGREGREGSQSQQESKGEGGGGGGEGGTLNGGSSSNGGQGQHATQNQAQVLVLTKAEGGINDIHNLMVLRHLETLTKNPALRALLAKLISSSTLSSSAAAAAAAGGSSGGGGGGSSGGGDEGGSGRADDRSRQFQCLRILVHQQVGREGGKREAERVGERDMYIELLYPFFWNAPKKYERQLDTSPSLPPCLTLSLSLPPLTQHSWPAASNSASAATSSMKPSKAAPPPAVAPSPAAAAARAAAGPAPLCQTC